MKNPQTPYKIKKHLDENLNTKGYFKFFIDEMEIFGTIILFNFVQLLVIGGISFGVSYFFPILSPISSLISFLIPLLIWTIVLYSVKDENGELDKEGSWINPKIAIPIFAVSTSALSASIILFSSILFSLILPIWLSLTLGTLIGLFMGNLVLFVVMLVGDGIHSKDLDKSEIRDIRLGQLLGD